MVPPVVGVIVVPAVAVAEVAEVAVGLVVDEVGLVVPMAEVAVVEVVPGLTGSSGSPHATSDEPRAQASSARKDREVGRNEEWDAEEVRMRMLRRLCWRL